MVLLHRSAESENRFLKSAGAILVLTVVMAAVLFIVIDPFGGKPKDVISLSIDTPYVGQGVAAGTPVIMHGVKIGQVNSVSNINGGGVRLQADFQQAPSQGLTDAMGIDYRPSNYFGVTGINVIPAQNGAPLRNGMQITITPKGNFSLQALLYRLGELSNGVFNPKLVSVVERATRYADGLNPLLETVLIVGNSVAQTQNVSSERLLRNATGISVAFPATITSLINLGDDFLYTPFLKFTKEDEENFKKNDKFYAVWDDARKRHFEKNADLFRATADAGDEYWTNHFNPLFDSARTDLFSRVGYLLGSHINDLYPLLDSVRGLADTVPKIVSPDSFAYTITELRQRFEKMYAGSGDQRALQVRIVLDRLPAIAAPLHLPTGGSS